MRTFIKKAEGMGNFHRSNVALLMGYVHAVDAFGHTDWIDAGILQREIWEAYYGPEYVY